MKRKAAPGPKKISSRVIVAAIFIILVIAAFIYWNRNAYVPAELKKIFEGH